MKLFSIEAYRWLLLQGVFAGYVANAAAAPEFLEPDQAFVLEAPQISAQSVVLSFRVAPGYYLYRERFAFAAQGATLGEPVLPPGVIKYDSNFEKNVETYHASLLVRIPVREAAGMWRLTVSYQGCAEAGLCYPPQTVEFKLPAVDAKTEERSPPQTSPGQDRQVPAPSRDSAREQAVQSSGGVNKAGTPLSVDEGGEETSNIGRVQALLQHGSWGAIGGAFVLMGLLLAFTPCVLPMLPILSSIIVGGGVVTRKRGFLLALSYSMGMAAVYTALGVAAGLAGEGLAAQLQKPWVLITFASLLIVLSLAMFDLYELRLPAAFSSRMDQASRRAKPGHPLGVFVMGGLSALIVSPCVSAPLAGILVFLSQSRDVVLAGGALFFLAVGMSVPLLVLGASAGEWLPRSGAWMHTIKRSFGLLLIGVAIWVAQPAVPPSAALVAWAALLLVTGFMLRPFDPNPHSAAPRVWVQRAAGIAALAYGVMQLAGAASGGTDVLQPLSHFVVPGEARNTASKADADINRVLAFRRVKTSAELDQLLQNSDRPVMLDFYADWCVACKEMERFTFTDPSIRQQLASATLVQADVTANDEADRVLLKRFQLFGPPGILFFAPGQKVPHVRVIGFEDAGDFKKSLRNAGL